MNGAWASFRSYDFTGVTVTPGWTKKELVKFVEELRKEELKHIESVKESFNRAIAKFENSARAIIASCPPQILERPYFECVEKICSGTKDNLINNLIQEEKKRSRQEWEDAVRTRTGKRPRTAGRALSTQSNRGTRSTRKKQSSSLSTESMPLIMESDNEALELDVETTVFTQKLIKSSNQKTNAFAVASTPIDGTRPVFAVPTTRCKARLNTQPLSSVNPPATRSRLRSAQQMQVTGKSPALVSNQLGPKRSALKPRERLLSPRDTIQSLHGTPLKNPLSLLNEKGSLNLSSPEIRQLKDLVLSMQKTLDRL